MSLHQIVKARSLTRFVSHDVCRTSTRSWGQTVGSSSRIYPMLHSTYRCHWYRVTAPLFLGSFSRVAITSFSLLNQEFSKHCSSTLGVPKTYGKSLWGPNPVHNNSRTWSIFSIVGYSRMFYCPQDLLYFYLSPIKSDIKEIWKKSKKMIIL